MTVPEIAVMNKGVQHGRQISELFSDSHHVNVLGNMSTIIYKEIVRKIHSHELKQGQRITESQISEEFQVSSMPVREAMFKLESKGWFERIPNKGSFVSDYRDQNKLRGLFLARKSVEIGAFYNLVKQVTDEQLGHLEQLIRTVELTYEQKQLNAYREADAFYHYTAVIYGVGREMQEYFEQTLLKCSAFVDGPEDPEVFMKYPLDTHHPTHHEIHEALKARNESLVLRLVDEHISSGPRAAGLEI